MKQIELLLQNKGVSKSVIFPCSEAEYQATCEELELKDNYACRDLLSSAFRRDFCGTDLRDDMLKCLITVL